MTIKTTRMDHVNMCFIKLYQTKKSKAEPKWVYVFFAGITTR